MGDNCPKWELSGGQLSSVIIVQEAMVQDAVVQGELPCRHVKHVAPKNELKFLRCEFLEGKCLNEVKVKAFDQTKGSSAM